MFGVTPDGFVKKPLSVIQAEMRSYLRAKISKRLQLTEKTGLGNVLNSAADQIAELWAVAQANYHAFDKDNAFEDAFVALCLLTGTKRRGASKGGVMTSCDFAGGTTYPAGALVAHVDGAPDNRWVNRDNVVTKAAGSYPVLFDAETAGAHGVALAGTLTRIAQPVSGWNAVVNAVDATPGTDVESLESLYERREQELEGSGAGTISAIRASVSKVLGVLQVRSLENKSNYNTPNVPANSFRIIVWDGPSPLADNNAIAQAILDSAAGGIASSGMQSGTAINEDGEAETVYFDRAQGVPVYVSVDVSGSPEGVAEAVVKEGKKLKIGDLVVRQKLEGAVARLPGVTDVLSFTLGLTASPVGTSNFQTTPFQVPLFDESRIVVT